MPRTKKRTLDQIHADIERLRQEAARVMAAEREGVIGRIQEAINHYDIQASELRFGRRTAAADATGRGRKTGRSVGGKRAKAGNAAKAGREAAESSVENGAAKVPAKPKKKAAAGRASVIKYRDGAGNEWTGNGQRPRWFLAALAAGKTKEDLLVKADVA